MHIQNHAYYQNPSPIYIISNSNYPPPLGSIIIYVLLNFRTCTWNWMAEKWILNLHIRCIVWNWWDIIHFQKRLGIPTELFILLFISLTKLSFVRSKNIIYLCPMQLPHELIHSNGYYIFYINTYESCYIRNTFSKIKWSISVYKGIEERHGKVYGMAYKLQKVK